MAGLLLIEMMSCRNKNILRILEEMERQFGRYYYLRLDLKLKRQAALRREELPAQLLGRPVTQVKDYDGIKLICDDQSWLMFRGSGTEPLMRVYAEAKSLARARGLLALGKKIVLGK
jgi:phosphomannomutase